MTLYTRVLGLTLVLSVAFQVFPETRQIYPPGAAPATIRVNTASELQPALDRARGGDVVELAAGVTFSGNFVLPEKPGTRYTVVRSRLSAGLPGTSGRIGPEHSPKLARIVSPNGTPALRTAPNAHHWRLMFLEIGPNAQPSSDILVLGDATSAQSGDGRVPHDIIVDRCYVHGDPDRGQKRGIALNSAATIVSGSYIADIKLQGQDSQAIGGWNGPGPFLIENNYLEASGENFMLGGATPATGGLVPSDVVFRRNHVSRPLSWRTERWDVKNLFELKNARRVLVEGNLFENNWVDAQPGFAIVLTPRGERGNAPWATVEDVTFRFNIVRTVSAAFNLLARDDAGESGTARRIRIADNLVYDMNRQVLGGNGTFLQIGQGPAEVVVEHNTVLQTGNLITVYGGTRTSPAAAAGFVFRNNLALHNTSGVIGDGRTFGTPTLSAFFPSAIFEQNVLAGGLSSRYPEGNLFPDVARFQQQFVNYAGRDFRLRPDSEFRRAATDGSDLGVNFIGLARALGGRAREWLDIGPGAR